MSTAIEQPYVYRHRELVEPDWTRFPGWRDVTATDWASAQWQRAHCVKNLKQLRELMGDLLQCGWPGSGQVGAPVVPSGALMSE